jgi:1-acylglycerone phosphate reductase
MPPLRQLKTALITGCSSGIGQALALEFASRGYCVVATARNAADLLELEKLHPNIVAHELDVRSSESIRVLREEVRKLTGGGLDFLINNAGTHYGSTALDIDADQVRDVFEVNVVAVMLMCQAFAESLITARGVIVQIGSVTRAVPVVWQSPYNATKAALSQYTNTLRLVRWLPFWQIWATLLICCRSSIHLAYELWKS